jgi:hypothetical protein
MRNRLPESIRDELLLLASEETRRIRSRVRRTVGLFVIGLMMLGWLGALRFGYSFWAMGYLTFLGLLFIFLRSLQRQQTIRPAHFVDRLLKEYPSLNELSLREVGNQKQIRTRMLQLWNELDHQRLLTPQSSWLPLSFLLLAGFVGIGFETYQLKQNNPFRSFHANPTSKQFSADEPLRISFWWDNPNEVDFEPEFFFRTDGESLARLQATTQDENGVYQVDLGIQPSSGEWSVRVGPKWHRWTHLERIEKNWEMRSFARLTYPGYTGMTNQLIEDPEDLILPEGTKVLLEWQSLQKMDDASLQINSLGAMETVVVDSSGMKFRWEGIVAASTEIRLRIKEVSGGWSEKKLLTLRIRPDLLPRYVECFGFESICLDLLTSIPFRFRFQDDYQVVTACIELRADAEGPISRVNIPIQSQSNPCWSGSLHFESEQGSRRFKQYRLKLTDNRDLPELNLKANEVFFPAKDWIELADTAISSDPNQAIWLARRDRIAKRLNELEAESLLLAVKLEEIAFEAGKGLSLERWYELKAVAHANLNALINSCNELQNDPRHVGPELKPLRVSLQSRNEELRKLRDQLGALSIESPREEKYTRLTTLSAQLREQTKTIAQTRQLNLVLTEQSLKIEQVQKSFQYWYAAEKNMLPIDRAKFAEDLRNDLREVARQNPALNSALFQHFHKQNGGLAQFWEELYTHLSQLHLDLSLVEQMKLQSQFQLKKDWLFNTQQSYQSLLEQRGKSSRLRRVALPDSELLPKIGKAIEQKDWPTYIDGLNRWKQELQKYDSGWKDLHSLSSDPIQTVRLTGRWLAEFRQRLTSSTTIARWKTALEVEKQSYIDESKEIVAEVRSWNFPRESDLVQRHEKILSQLQELQSQFLKPEIDDLPLRLTSIETEIDRMSEAIPSLEKRILSSRSQFQTVKPAWLAISRRIDEILLNGTAESDISKMKRSLQNEVPGLIVVRDRILKIDFATFAEAKNELNTAFQAVISAGLRAEVRSIRTLQNEVSRHIFLLECYLEQKRSPFERLAALDRTIEEGLSQPNVPNLDASLHRQWRDIPQSISPIMHAAIQELLRSSDAKSESGALRRSREKALRLVRELQQRWQGKPTGMARMEAVLIALDKLQIEIEKSNLAESPKILLDLRIQLSGLINEIDQNGWPVITNDVRKLLVQTLEQARLATSVTDLKREWKVIQRHLAEFRERMEQNRPSIQIVSAENDPLSRLQQLVNQEIDVCERVSKLDQRFVLELVRSEQTLLDYLAPRSQIGLDCYDLINIHQGINPVMKRLRDKCIENAIRIQRVYVGKFQLNGFIQPLTRSWIASPIEDATLAEIVKLTETALRASINETYSGVRVWAGLLKGKLESIRRKTSSGAKEPIQGEHVQKYVSLIESMEAHLKALKNPVDNSRMRSLDNVKTEFEELIQKLKTDCSNRAQ